MGPVLRCKFPTKLDLPLYFFFPEKITFDNFQCNTLFLLLSGNREESRFGGKQQYSSMDIIVALSCRITACRVVLNSFSITRLAVERETLSFRWLKHTQMFLSMLVIFHHVLLT